MFSIAALSLAVLRRAVIQLRSGSLRLDETGFEFAGYRRERYLWSDVGDFRVERGGKFENVGFRVRPPKDDPDALFAGIFAGIEGANVDDEFRYSRTRELSRMARKNDRASANLSTSTAAIASTKAICLMQSWSWRTRS
ncbi:MULTISPECIES: hypothetical protein [Bradyrhizobium]|uniref:Uncharacterized protein n=1 Tax=Bradyrhizobium septentrionale TaxID=1404411 RepID=A0ABZ2P1R4_9BRAD